MKRKLSIPDRAAYATSAPLYEALRTACANGDTQSQLLQTARDHVQQIHVKVAKDQFEECFEPILKAWQSTLESYHSVFDALSSATKPPPGNEPASHHHIVFSVLKGSAGQALKSLNDYHPTIDAKKQPKQTSEQASSEDSAPSEEPIRSRKGSFQLHRIDDETPKKRKVSMQSDAGASIAPGASFKIPATPAAVRAGHGVATASGDHATAGPTGATPEQKYEDISDVVEARLKAKEEKRRLKKEAKKRKRASIESNASILDQPKADASKLAERPKKKARVTAEPETRSGTGTPTSGKQTPNSVAGQKEEAKVVKRRISTGEDGGQVAPEMKRRKRAKHSHG